MTETVIKNPPIAPGPVPFRPPPPVSIGGVLEFRVPSPGCLALYFTGKLQPGNQVMADMSKEDTDKLRALIALPAQS